MEVIGVIRQVGRRLQAARIERAFPTGGSKGGGFEMNRRGYGKDLSGLGLVLRP